MDVPPATVVWLAPEPDRVTAADRSALAEWSIAHGVHVRLAGPASLPELRAEQSIADGVEDELGRARDALAASDADAVERALARAEAPLRAHPELPQAAWLMAEVARGWSARWMRLEPRDEARAQVAWQRAEALDGGRAAGVGETAAPAPKKVAATLAIEASGDVEVHLDGTPVSPGALSVPEGEHALVVSQGGAARFAEWVTVAVGSELRVRVPSAPPCTTPDFAGVAQDGDTARADTVRCGAWVAVMPTATSGVIRVATCRAASCGPFTEWRVEAHRASTPPPEEPSAATRKRMPTWASIALFGAGIVATSTIAILISDAAHKPEPETRFVNGGVKTQRFGFGF